jgi:hypothetical protein
MRKVATGKAVILVVAFVLMVGGMVFRSEALLLLFSGFGALVAAFIIETVADVFSRRSDRPKQLPVGSQPFANITVTGNGVLIGDSEVRARMQYCPLPAGSWVIRLILGVTAGQHGVTGIELAREPRAELDSLELDLPVDSGLIVIIDEASERRGVHLDELRAVFSRVWQEIAGGRPGAAAILDSGGAVCGIAVAMAGGDGIYRVRRVSGESGQLAIDEAE